MYNYLAVCKEMSSGLFENFITDYAFTNRI